MRVWRAPNAVLFHLKTLISRVELWGVCLTRPPAPRWPPRRSSCFGNWSPSVRSAHQPSASGTPRLLWLRKVPGAAAHPDGRDTGVEGSGKSQIHTTLTNNQEAHFGTRALAPEESCRKANTGKRLVRGSGLTFTAGAGRPGPRPRLASQQDSVR